LGVFEPGEELKVVLEKQRQLSIQYEHSQHIKERECKAFDEAFNAWRLGLAEKHSEVTRRYETAKEKLGDAIAESYRLKQELEELESELGPLEWEEEWKVQEEAKKMKDIETGVESTSKS
jgi:regulator of replication initiation timing